MTQALAVLPAPDNSPAPQSRSAARTAMRQARADTILAAFNDLDASLDLSRGLVTLCADHDAPDLPTREAGLHWLAQGLTIRVKCNMASGGARWSSHKIRLNGDGTINVLSHGDDLYLEGEVMLAALSGRTAHCITVATLIPSGRRVTREAMGRGRTGGWQTLDSKVRAAWTAVQWAAQRPDAPWATIGPFLRYGLTPALYDEWHTHGWTIPTASAFIKNFVPVALANEWRDAGQATAAAAAVAGLGERPTVTHTWTAAGFSPSEAARWQRLTTLGPAEARRWQQAGFSPKATSQAFINHARYASTGRHPSPADLLAWAEAGVPAKHVPYWMHTTSGSLSDALLYLSAGVDSWTVNALQRPYQAQPFVPMGASRPTPVVIPGWTVPTSQEVVDMVNLGVAADSEALIVAFCRKNGLRR